MHQRMFATGLALAIGCTIPIVIDAVQQDAVQQAERRADAQSAEQLQLAKELPANPPDVAGAFVDFLAEGGPDAAQEGCMLFASTAAAQFAAAHRAPSCVVAMQELHDLVTDPAVYANDLSVPETVWTQMGPTATLNGCELSWSAPLSDTPSTAPGPLPGLWTLVQLDGEGWQISQYQAC